jgi:hypothetical protein
MENMNNFDTSNIGGPPIPLYQDCPGHTGLQPDITPEKQKLAYETFVSTTGYELFDLTKITDTAANNSINIVNNTSFFVFLSLFFIFTIILLILMYNNIINVVYGLYIIIILSLLIYFISILYRHNTISYILGNTQLLDNAIELNKLNYDNSIAYLPIALEQITKIINA